jgi:ubiquinone/menaquinone biosynthesis C-methylase UbiE
MNYTLSNFKQQISDVDIIRKSIRLFFMMGDNVRPIVQKPIVSEFIGITLYQHALDAGCGRGLYTRILLERANEVSALDYSENHINALKRRLGHLSKLSLHVGSADNLPFDSQQFDLVIHCEVLEHIDDDKKVLSEIFRILQPGGKLVISVPVPPAPFYDSEHVREGYTLEQISQLLKDSGFEILRYQYCMFDISKRIMKFEYWWKKTFKFPPPSILLLPVYWEKIFSSTAIKNNLPYDIVLEAKKP